MKIINDNSGFTFIELLIVLSILTIITSATIPIYGQLQVDSQFGEATSQIVQAVRQARERSLAGFHDSAHGVYFQNNPSARDKFILYQGNSYSTRDTNYDREVTLDPTIDLGTNLLNDEINFSKSLAEPSDDGVIFLQYNGENKKEIEINALGFTEQR